LQKITSLEESIIEIDEDIEKTLINVKQINNDVIKTKNDIE